MHSPFLTWLSGWQGGPLTRKVRETQRINGAIKVDFPPCSPILVSRARQEETEYPSESRLEKRKKKWKSGARAPFNLRARREIPPNPLSRDYAPAQLQPQTVLVVQSARVEQHATLGVHDAWLSRKNPTKQTRVSCRQLEYAVALISRTPSSQQPVSIDISSSLRILAPHHCRL